MTLSPHECAITRVARPPSATFAGSPARAYLAAAFSAVLLLLGSVPASADSTAIELQGRGVQIYDCAQNSGAVAWHLKAPEAALLDASGSEVGHHFAGPSWQSKDGSTVVGEAMVANQSPAPGSVPWLVLRAKSHAGTGMFASVEYIVRLQTNGGVAPAAGCDQAHVGSKISVPYSAVYVLFRAPSP